jgi:hypothetical protein
MARRSCTASGNRDRLQGGGRSKGDGVVTRSSCFEPNVQRSVPMTVASRSRLHDRARYWRCSSSGDECVEHDRLRRSASLVERPLRRPAWLRAERWPNRRNRLMATTERDRDPQGRRAPVLLHTPRWSTSLCKSMQAAPLHGQPRASLERPSSWRLRASSVHRLGRAWSKRGR